MVFRRRRFGRRRFGRRRFGRRRFRRFGMRRRFGGRRGYRRSRSLLSPERKFFDINPTDYFVAAGTAYWKLSNWLNCMGQGTSAITRLGERIKVVRIQILCRLNVDETTSRGTSGGKMVVILDRQANGALPGPDDVWVAPTGQKDYLSSFHNLSYRRRFRVLGTRKWGLSDRSTWHLSAPTLPAGTSIMSNAVNFSFNKRCRITTQFTDGSVGASSELITNGIVLFMIYQKVNAASGGGSPIYPAYQPPMQTFATRIRFVDP